MTDGLIVYEKYGVKLVEGTKKYEYRKTKIPKTKIGKEVFILTPKSEGSKILGVATFFPSNAGKTIWRAEEPVSYIGYDNHYKTKYGCVIWINDVEIL